MKSPGYIVTKGGRPCTLVRVPKLKADVLIPGEPIECFASLGAVDAALQVTMQRTSQLKGTRVIYPDGKKHASDSGRLFVVRPLRRKGKK